MDMLAIVVPVFAVIATGLVAVRTGLVPASIASGLGPIKVMPALAQARAKSAF